jgi:hypothetical protein
MKWAAPVAPALSVSPTSTVVVMLTNALTHPAKMKEIAAILSDHSLATVLGRFHW